MLISHPAPIVLFVYNRFSHTFRTLEALKKNRIAPETDLYIYSDGPKNETDVEEIEKIRKKLKSIKGFNKVKLILREENLGLSQSITTGVTELLSLFDRIIVLEDDLITSPAFLDYMNIMLQCFHERKEVFSISGFNYPSHVMKIPAAYPFDIYFSPRPSSWGWGTWRDRWDLADWDPNVFNQLKGKKDLVKLFNIGGDDLFKLLRLNYEGLVDSWAILWSYTLFKERGLCVYPTNSYIDNIGFDDQATHTTGKGKYKHDVLNFQIDKFQIPEAINLDPEIILAFQRIFAKRWIYKYYEQIKRLFHKQLD